MLYKSLVAEAVGVFALCFIGGGAIYADAHLGSGGGSGLLGIAIAHGLALSIAVTATMNVSGGHINPAVTIAMLVTGRIPFVNALAYIVAQCVGGLLAGFLLSGVVFANIDTAPGDTQGPVVNQTWAASPHFDVKKLGATNEIDDTEALSAKVDAGQAARTAALIEGILTFFLVFAVFGTAVDPRHPNVGGFGIGLTITADILVGGPLTGAAMNPARYIGTGFWWMGPEFWEQLWVYCVGPIAGGIVAALLYQHVILAPAKPAPSA